MDISETYLTLGAATFELGVAVATAAAVAFMPRARKFAVVLLGAVTPLLVAYTFVAGSYLFASPSPRGTFPYSAIWVLSFVVYLAFVLVGTVLAFIPKPSNLYSRYLIGLASAPISYALLNLVSQAGLRCLTSYPSGRDSSYAFDEPEFVKNFQMHLLVENVDDWHAHILAAGVPVRFGIKLREPENQPWGMRDFTLFDPSGVLWRIAQNIPRGGAA